MKAFLFWIVFSLCASVAPPLKAQYYFYNDQYFGSTIIIEAGSSAGIMNSLTDLGGRKGIGKKFIKDLNWKVSRPSYSIYIAALYKEAIGLRLEGTTGSIVSYDSLLKNSDPNLGERYGRNLSFQSSITDFQLGLEIHPLFFKRYEENETPFLSPYLIAGIGYYAFNPQAGLDGRLYALHPLRLEGQGFAEYPDHKPYRLRQWNMPVGVAIKYEMSALLQVRLEIVHRILFTDYLDDVSTTYIDGSLFTNYLPGRLASIALALHRRMKELQPAYNVTDGMKRGNSSDNDAFFSIQLKIGWVFRNRSSK
jgi:hypothetical protein